MSNPLHGILLFLFMCFSGVTFGQNITVLDAVSQERIPSATVFSNSPKIKKLTDRDGFFNLDDFEGCDSIYVSYTSYETLGMTYAQVKDKGSFEMNDEALAVSEMTASGNRWEQDRIKEPNRITKINIRDAEFLGPQTSADLLESSGYVFVQKSQLAGGSPQMRGFGTNRVMIVVDGIRMNNAIFRSGNLQNVISLDASSLQSVEVLFGPGSVMYGSDAIGGVMSFQTKLANFSPDSLNTYIKTNVFARYSSSSNEMTGHFDFNIGKKKWAFLTAATYSHFDDLNAGKYGHSDFLRPTYQTNLDGQDSTVANPNPQLQVHSGYAQLNVMQKIQFKPSDRWFFEYGFIYSTTSNAPRYDRLIQDDDEDGVLDKAEWYYGPQSWMMHRLSILNQTNRSLIHDRMNLTMAYQKYNESRHDRKIGSSLIRRQFEQVDAFSLNMDLDKKIGARTTLFYGLEAVINRVGSNAYREPIDGGDQIKINSRYPDGALWQTYGIYYNLKYDITEKWIFNTGMRFTVYHIKADFDTTLFAFPVASTTNSNNALNGSVGLVYNPNKRAQIYLNISTGFRAPNVDDLGKVFDSEPGIVVVPNVDLKPEYAYNAEIGFVTAIKSYVKIDGAIYGTYLKDALARANYSFNDQDSILYDGQLSQVMAVQNVSNAYVYGAQGGIEVSFGKGFSLKSMISFQEGFEYNIDSARYYPKSHVAPLFGRTSFTYKRKKLRLELYAVYHAKMKYDDLPLYERGDYVYAQDENGQSFAPSWYTINFKGTFFFNKHISVTAGVENITDQLYRTYGSGISASGRNFMISLKGSF
ncbi:MAG: TonB-dependent receptor [Crocinitomicaceae bacterium]|nr:TonB-dependent receptor [Crocinitomicaceae bacterium]